ncbi:hypothetical protein QBC35DRAFT_477226 [Podospora australis]|uniref:P-type ATPase A domain-containing protein n=1 Tax=Podospora australis TaxID=1536484 RepID=A0AAN6WQE9_9PEZI|nr:hypothetical protein QBC35DRAFT_477226 [Podospora australis]
MSANISPSSDPVAEQLKAGEADIADTTNTNLVDSSQCLTELSNSNNDTIAEMTNTDSGSSHFAEQSSKSEADMAGTTNTNSDMDSSQRLTEQSNPGDVTMAGMTNTDSASPQHLAEQSRNGDVNTPGTTNSGVNSSQFTFKMTTNPSSGSSSLIDRPLTAGLDYDTLPSMMEVDPSLFDVSLDSVIDPEIPDATQTFPPHQNTQGHMTSGELGDVVNSAQPHPTDEAAQNTSDGTTTPLSIAARPGSRALGHMNEDQPRHLPSLRPGRSASYARQVFLTYVLEQPLSVSDSTAGSSSDKDMPLDITADHLRRFQDRKAASRASVASIQASYQNRTAIWQRSTGIPAHQQTAIANQVFPENVASNPSPHQPVTSTHAPQLVMRHREVPEQTMTSNPDNQLSLTGFGVSPEYSTGIDPSPEYLGSFESPHALTRVHAPHQPRTTRIQTPHEFVPGLDVSPQNFTENHASQPSLTGYDASRRNMTGSHNSHQRLTYNQTPYMNPDYYTVPREGMTGLDAPEQTPSPPMSTMVESAEAAADQAVKEIDWEDFVNFDMGGASRVQQDEQNQDGMFLGDDGSVSIVELSAVPVVDLTSDSPTELITTNVRPYRLSLPEPASDISELRTTDSGVAVTTRSAAVSTSAPRSTKSDRLKSNQPQQSDAQAGQSGNVRPSEAAPPASAPITPSAASTNRQPTVVASSGGAQDARALLDGLATGIGSRPAPVSRLLASSGMRYRRSVGADRPAFPPSQLRPAPLGGPPLGGPPRGGPARRPAAPSPTALAPAVRPPGLHPAQDAHGIFPRFGEFPLELKQMVWVEALRKPSAHWARALATRTGNRWRLTFKPRVSPDGSGFRLLAKIEKVDAESESAVALVAKKSVFARIPFGSLRNEIDADCDVVVLEFDQVSLAKIPQPMFHRSNQVSNPEFDPVGTWVRTLAQVKRFGLLYKESFKLCSDPTSSVLPCALGPEHDGLGNHTGFRFCYEELAGFVDSLPAVEEFFLVLGDKTKGNLNWYRQVFFSLSSEERRRCGYSMFYEERRVLVEWDRDLVTSWSGPVPRGQPSPRQLWRTNALLLQAERLVAVAPGLLRKDPQDLRDEDGDWARQYYRPREGRLKIKFKILIILYDFPKAYHQSSQRQRKTKSSHGWKRHSRKVIRSGKSTEVSVFNIMVSDIIHLVAGDMVPLDGICISGHGVKFDESSLILWRWHSRESCNGSTFSDSTTRTRNLVARCRVRHLNPCLLSNSPATYYTTATVKNNALGPTTCEPPKNKSLGA